MNNRFVGFIVLCFTGCHTCGNLSMASSRLNTRSIQSWSARHGNPIVWWMYLRAKNGIASFGGSPPAPLEGEVAAPWPTNTSTKVLLLLLLLDDAEPVNTAGRNESVAGKFGSLLVPNASGCNALCT